MTTKFETKEAQEMAIGAFLNKCQNYLKEQNVEGNTYELIAYASLTISTVIGHCQDCRTLAAKLLLEFTRYSSSEEAFVDFFSTLRDLILTNPEIFTKKECRDN